MNVPARRPCLGRRVEATQRSLQLRAENWKDIVVDLCRALFLPASLLLLAVAFLFRLGDGLWITLAPVVVVQQLGYASTDYTSWTAIVSFIAAMAGLPLGLYIDRKGAKWLYGCGAIALCTCSP